MLILCSCTAWAKDVDVSIDAVPGIATVRINGMIRGETPIIVSIRVNTIMHIEVSQDDSEPVIFDYTAKKNDTILVDLEKRKWVFGTSKVKQYLENRNKPAAVPEEKDSDDSPVLPEVVFVDDDTGGKNSGRLVPQIKNTPDPVGLDKLIPQKSAKGVTGFRVYIDHRGRFQKIGLALQSGRENLDQYFLEWIKKWSFAPARKGGFPVSSALDVGIDYDLPKKITVHSNFNLPGAPPPVSAPPEQSTRVVDISKMKSNADSEAGQPESQAVESSVPTEVPTPEPVPTATSVPAKPRPQGPFPDCDNPAKVDVKPSVIQPPKLLSIPVKIINLNLKGNAVFKLLIMADGTVSDVNVSVSTGSDELDKWLIPFIKQSLWEPGKKSGKPIVCWRSMKVSFYTTACRFDFPDLFE